MSDSDLSRRGRMGVARIRLGELSTRIQMKVRTSPIRMMAWCCRGGQDTCLVNGFASCRLRFIPNGRPQGGRPSIGLWIIRFHNIYGRLDWSGAAEFPDSVARFSKTLGYQVSNLIHKVFHGFSRQCGVTLSLAPPDLASIKNRNS